MGVFVVDNVPLCPDYEQQYQQQQSFSSDQNTVDSSLEPAQNQAFPARPQYYSSPGSHSQMVHGALQACNTQQHYSSVYSQLQQPVPPSASGEYSSSWHQPVPSMNYTGDVGAGNYRSQFCRFDNQQQAVLGKNRQRFDDDVKLKQQYASGFRAPASMQHSFVGSQQMPSSLGVIQNHRDGEMNMSDMSQTQIIGANRQQMMFQQQGMLADPHRQAAGFAVQRPREFVAAPGQHIMNREPSTITDAFTGYQSQLSRSFTVQHQQQASWNEPRDCQSYTQTGCSAVAYKVLIISILYDATRYILRTLKKTDSQFSLEHGTTRSSAIAE